MTLTPDACGDRQDALEIFWFTLQGIASIRTLFSRRAPARTAASGSTITSNSPCSSHLSLAEPAPDLELRQLHRGRPFLTPKRPLRVAHETVE